MSNALQMTTCNALNFVVMLKVPALGIDLTMIGSLTSPAPHHAYAFFQNISGVLGSNFTPTALSWPRFHSGHVYRLGQAPPASPLLSSGR
jgi:hypothetical protein